MSISKNRTHKITDHAIKKWNDLGFRIGPYTGAVEAVAVGDNPEQYKSAPSDMRITDTFPGEFSFYGAWLMTEGVTVAGASHDLFNTVIKKVPDSARSSGYARISRDYLFDAFSDGVVAANFDDAGELRLALRPDVFLTWRWPLESIDFIFCPMMKKFGKWFELKFHIMLNNGDNTDARSILSLISVHADKEGKAAMGGKGLCPFAQLLANCVAARRNTPATYEVKEDGKFRALGWSLSPSGLPDYWTTETAEALAEF